MCCTVCCIVFRNVSHCCTTTLTVRQQALTQPACCHYGFFTCNRKPRRREAITSLLAASTSKMRFCRSQLESWWCRNWCQKQSRNVWNPFWEGEKPNNSMWLKYSAGRCVAAALSSGCWMVSFSSWPLSLFGSRPAWPIKEFASRIANIECASTLAQDGWDLRATGEQESITCSSCRPRQMEEVVCWQIFGSGKVNMPFSQRLLCFWCCKDSKSHCLLVRKWVAQHRQWHVWGHLYQTRFGVHTECADPSP